MSCQQRPEYRHLVVQRSGAVATLVLSRPERENALSPVVINELLWALDDAREDPSVRVLVLAAAGKTFCAGADLQEMTGLSEESELAPKGDLSELLLRFPRLHKPVIARVHGAALGAGLGLVASCHFALAAESALLGTPEILRGLFPMQIMAVLDRLLPRRRLLELMLLGRPITAATAEAWGLVTRAVPDDQLAQATEALAEQLAAQSPTAVHSGLSALCAQDGKSLEEALPLLRGELIGLLSKEDAMEGLAAALQKRAPVWKGR